MKTLNDAVTCLLSFGSAEDGKGLKKLYKKAALLVHSDRAKAHGITYTMTDVNRAWELVSKSLEGALGLIEGSIVSRRNRAFSDSWMNDPLHEATVPSFYSVDTMAEKAWQIVDSGETGDFTWFNPSKHSTFIKDLNLEYRYYYGGDVLALYSLENAFKTGKQSTGYRICYDRNGDGHFMEAFSEILNELCNSQTPKGVWKWLESLEFVDGGPYQGVRAEVTIGRHTVRVYRDNVPGNKQFSPFDLDRVKPVAKIPKKWTVVHLRKILANGQFRSYKQDYYYTDDYSRDAADNYRKGYFSNPLESYSDILTCTSQRVWSREEEGIIELHFGAHRNDGRSLIVDLNNRYPVVDMSDEEQEYLKGDIHFLKAS